MHPGFLPDRQRARKYGVLSFAVNSFRREEKTSRKRERSSAGGDTKDTAGPRREHLRMKCRRKLSFGLHLQLHHMFRLDARRCVARVEDQRGGLNDFGVIKL